MPSFFGTQGQIVGLKHNGEPLDYPGREVADGAGGQPAVAPAPRGGRAPGNRGAARLRGHHAVADWVGGDADDRHGGARPARDRRHRSAYRAGGDGPDADPAHHVLAPAPPKSPGRLLTRGSICHDLWVNGWYTSASSSARRPAHHREDTCGSLTEEPASPANGAFHTGAVVRHQAPLAGRRGGPGACRCGAGGDSWTGAEPAPRWRWSRPARARRARDDHGRAGAGASTPTRCCGWRGARASSTRGPITAAAGPRGSSSSSPAPGPGPARRGPGPGLTVRRGQRGGGRLLMKTQGPRHWTCH